jgi:hypothetical protein
MRYVVPLAGLGSRGVPGKFRVQVNVLEDFDPAAQSLQIIDGKSVW